MLKARLKIWLIGAIGLLIWLLVVWLVVSFLGLGRRETQSVAAFLIILGVSAISSLIWYFLKQLKAKEGPAEGQRVDEVDTAINTARKRLVAAKLSDKTKLSQLPLILCIGPSDSAKTSILIRSGLDPDLLTGEVQRGDAIVATRGVNLWYSNKTILLEAGGRLVADQHRFSRLIRHIQPSRTSAVLSSGRQAPRIAIVTLSTEDLVRPGGGEQVLNHARELRARLLEVSKKLGIRLPVYVVFTKADKIPYFTDFVRNFSSEEAKEVLGATLPWDSGPAGTYADRTASRIGNAMQRLAGSLAGHRLQFLPRETQTPVLYGAYEFAREFRKIVPQATQFLVDVCKPSQLEVSPVLRGFYFSGVRAVVVEESGPMAPQQQRQQQSAMDATQAFVPSMFGAQQPSAGVVGSVSRKVPQWMFLGRLFKDVIFKDRVALAATAGGARVNTLRRILLATAAGISIFYALMLLISFVGNRRLKNKVEAVIRDVSADPLPANDLASATTLHRLDALRGVVDTLGRWKRGGSPIGLSWGLYSGDRLYRSANAFYFNRFDSLLYAGTRFRILEDLRNMPVVRADTGEFSDYQWSYGLLKTHLITSAFHDSARADYVVPILMRAWNQGHPTVSDEKRRLAEAQFTFFAEELARGNNLVPEGTDNALAKKAQIYLGQFKGGIQIYQIMQSEATRNGAATFDFDKTHAGAGQVMTAAHQVPGVFTRAGWTYMWEKAFKKPEEYFKGEEWVLGVEKLSENQKYAILDSIKAWYRRDYADQWRGVLVDARLAQVNSLADGGRKMLVLGSNTSPVIQLINAVSWNVGVDSSISRLFVPATVVSPPDTVNLVGEKTKPYLAAVLQTGTALQSIATSGDQQQDAATAAKTAVLTAKNAALTLKLDYGADPYNVGNEITRLLTEGLTRIDGLIGNVGSKRANDAGAGLCSDVNVVLRKKPFNPLGPDATVKDLDNIFQRDKGAIANQLKGPIGTYVVEQGDGYAPAPGSKTSKLFTEWLSKAAQFTKAMYPAEGQPGPRFTFTFRPLFTNDFSQVTLSVDGRTLQYTPTITGEKGIAWNLKEATDARVDVMIRGNPQPLSRTGAWSLFQLFGQARGWKQVNSKYQAYWVFTHEGKDVSIPFELNFLGAAPILSPDWLRAVSCVSTISN